MRNLILFVGAVAASPAAAATGPFFSLRNTDFIVSIGFVIFIGIVFYFKVPSRITDMLDNRATGIQSDLDEARSLREEADSLLKSYERKTREAHEQADRIVADAKAQAQQSADQARLDLGTSVERRLAAAEDQIENARNAAVKEVRDTAVTVAVAAAAEAMAKQTSDQDAAAMIDRSIETVGAKLH